MTNVLIPTDFSEYSINAIRYALDYFGGMEVNFFLLHVSDEPATKEYGFLYGENRDQVQTIHSATAQKLLEVPGLTANKPHKFFPIEESGSVLEAIRKHVLSKNIEFIVMGTKGILCEPEDRSVSNTYEVITKIKCATLVVPEHARFEDEMTVSFVTDYNCIYRNKVLEILSKTLELHQSPLRVLKPRSKERQLTPAQIDNRGFIHYFFREREHSFHFLKHDNLEKGIEQFVDEFHITMIAIPARNLNFIHKLMLRLPSGEISYHTRIPFLVIHE